MLTPAAKATHFPWTFAGMDFSSRDTKSLAHVFSRLTFILMGGGLFFLVCVFLVIQARWTDSALRQNTNLAAELLAQKIQDPLLYSDPEILTRHFQTLAESASVYRSCLYDANQHLIASLIKQGAAVCPQKPGTPESTSWNTYRSSQDVRWRMQALGTLTLESDRSQVWQSTLLLGVILLSVSIVVLLLILAATRRITRPALHSLTDQTRSAQADAIRNEKLLREIIDLVPYLIYAVRQNGHILFVNRAVASIYGTEIRQIMCGDFQREYGGRKPDGLLFLAPPDDSDKAEGLETETSLQDSNGNIRHLKVQRDEVSASSFNEPFQLIVGVDVTEEKQLQLQLQFSQRLEVIGTLAGGIAHDFNNLLTPIMGYTSILLESEHDQHNKKRLDAIYSAALKARDLVRQILTFSRQNSEPSGKQRLDVASLIEEALKLLRPGIPSSIRFELDFQHNSDNVFVEPGQLHQVILNLVTNAAQAITDSRGTITLRVNNVEITRAGCVNRLPRGNYVRIQVEDTGRGIPENIQERIFEPFFTTKGVGEGTGLGLSVVHGIITGHDGEVDVHSEPGSGSTLSVYLPAAVTTRSRKVAQSEPTVRILLVDDDQHALESTRDLLLHAGYSPSAFTCPELALDAFQAKPDSFDLVLSDHVMPKMNGLELAREIRLIRPSTPVVLITGYDDIDTTHLIDIKLQKPVSIRELSESIESIFTAEEAL